MPKIRVLLCVLSLVVGSPAALAAWSVQKTTGEVAVTSPGATPVSLGSATELVDGTTISTGPSGRAFLVRNKETIVIGPNSVVTIPGDTANGFTRILEKAGSVEFDVERRNVKHFQVDTPFLAALVKGTHFVVTVGPQGAAVSVSRGKVGVTDTRRGGNIDILPGQTAKVTTTATLSVTGVIDADAMEPTVQASAAEDKGKDENTAQDDDHNAHDNSGSDNSGEGSGGSGNSNSNSGSGNSGQGSGGSGNSNGGGNIGGSGRGKD